MKKNISLGILTLITLLLFLPIVHSVDFSPYSNIQMYKIYNVTAGNRANYTEFCSFANCTNMTYILANLGGSGSGDITAVNTDGKYLSGGASTGAVSLLYNETVANETMDARDTDTRWSINTSTLINQSGNLSSNRTWLDSRYLRIVNFVWAGLTGKPFNTVGTSNGLQIPASLVLDINHTIFESLYCQLTGCNITGDLNVSKTLYINKSCYSDGCYSDILSINQTDTNESVQVNSYLGNITTCSNAQFGQGNYGNGSSRCVDANYTTDTNDTIKLDSLIGNFSKCSGSQLSQGMETDGSSRCVPSNVTDTNESVKLNSYLSNITLCSGNQLSQGNNPNGSTRCVPENDTLFTAGTGIDLTGTIFSHTNTSSQANSTSAGRTYIQDLLFDKFGHVTSVTTATETVVDTNSTAKLLSLVGNLSVCTGEKVGQGTYTNGSARCVVINHTTDTNDTVKLLSLIGNFSKCTGTQLSQGMETDGSSRCVVSNASDTNDTVKLLSLIGNFSKCSGTQLSQGMETDGSSRCVPSNGTDTNMSAGGLSMRVLGSGSIGSLNMKEQGIRYKIGTDTDILFITSNTSVDVDGSGIFRVRNGSAPSGVDMIQMDFRNGKGRIRGINTTGGLWPLTLGGIETTLANTTSTFTGFGLGEQCNFDGDHIGCTGTFWLMPDQTTDIALGSGVGLELNVRNASGERDFLIDISTQGDQIFFQNKNNKNLTVITDLITEGREIPNNITASTYRQIFYMNADNNTKDWSGYGSGADTVNAINYFYSPRGQSFVMDGVHSQIKVNDSSKLNMTQNVTVMFWAKLNNDTETNNGGVAKGFILGSSSEFSFTLQFSGGNAQWGVSNSTTTKLISKATPGSNQWHFYTGTYNGTTSCLYIDAKPPTCQASTIGNMATVARPLGVGGRPTGTSYPINGSLDEVRIFDRKLVHEEIISWYELNQPVITSSTYDRPLLRRNGKNTDIRDTGNSCSYWNGTTRIDEAVCTV